MSAKFLILILTPLNLLMCQSLEFPTVKGSAKLIGSWNSISSKEIYFNSSGLENFTIFHGQQGMYLTVNYKNVREFLTQVYNINAEAGIKVYEYDFDNDSDLEYIIISGDKPINVDVQIYKVSKGLTKLIGKFKVQHDVLVSKNFISFPYGSQGLTNEYYFRDDAFFELIYHNPNGK